jgi:hypothetical protein
VRAKLAALEGEIAPLKAVATRYETEAKAWATERTFLEAGFVDAEAREIALLFHGRIPSVRRWGTG